ncbi:MAG: hypothetical protein ABIJ27_08840 [Candidatus Omnitrophota bacterium]
MKNIRFRAVKIAVASAGILAALACFAIAENVAAEKRIFSFEDGMQGWEIPDWAYDQAEYVCKAIRPSGDVASDGSSSLMLDVDFKPGHGWEAAVAEILGPFDWSEYNAVICDVYVPEQGNDSLFARLIITVGDEWQWAEMIRPVKLSPGEWTTVKAGLKAGNRFQSSEVVEKIDEKNKDYGLVKKKFKVEITEEHKKNVQMLAVRVESNGKEYHGPIYVDNVRLSERSSGGKAD